jgi:hypothetical protein
MALGSNGWDESGKLSKLHATFMHSANLGGGSRVFNMSSSAATPYSGADSCASMQL